MRKYDEKNKRLIITDELDNGMTVKEFAKTMLDLQNKETSNSQLDPEFENYCKEYVEKCKKLIKANYKNITKDNVTYKKAHKAKEWDKNYINKYLAIAESLNIDDEEK